MPDSIEPVQKVETSASQPVSSAESEHGTANADHFQNLLNSNQPFQTSFERVNTEGIPKDAVDKTENNPVFAEDNSSSQKSGSSTDQDKKGKKGRDDEVEEVGQTSRSRGTQNVSGSEPLTSKIEDLGTKLKRIEELNPEQLKTQTKDLIAQIDKVKTQLSSAKEIKPSYQTLLKNRLGHIDDNLKIALSKAGIEYKPEASSAASSSGIKSAERFIDSFTSSQTELNKLYGRLEELGKPGAPPLSPANMMAIQMKVGYIQQQIELFTNLLNKALESVKTVMNVQV